MIRLDFESLSPKDLVQASKTPFEFTQNNQNFAPLIVKEWAGVSRILPVPDQFRST